MLLIYLNITQIFLYLIVLLDAIKCNLKRNKNPYFNYISNYLCDYSKLERETERYNPPKLTENSVLIYHSQKITNHFRAFKSTTLPVFCLIPIFCENPLFYFIFFGATYMAYFRSVIYETSNRLPVRVDYLPNINSISIIRVGLFGRLYNSIYKMNDFEKIKFDITDENMFWNLNKLVLENDYGYKIKSTNEIIMFEKNGLWNWEGINHPLLNKK